MAAAPDPGARPARRRRRVSGGVAIALTIALVAVVALVGWVLTTRLDGGDDAEARWEKCAARVDPPADRAARVQELREAEDVEAARARLARETARVERRIEAECGERP